MITKCGNAKCECFDLNEDNYCMGRDDIENCPNFEELEPEICQTCNGSGEGQYDKTICRDCGGSGELKIDEPVF